MIVFEERLVCLCMCLVSFGQRNVVAHLSLNAVGLRTIYI